MYQIDNDEDDDNDDDDDGGMISSWTVAGVDPSGVDAPPSNTPIHPTLHALYICVLICICTDV